MTADEWFSNAGKFASDVLGLGPNSHARGLSTAATALAETLDRTIQNTYIDSGWTNPSKTNPNVRNIVTQNPELIVLIKKRMFSSLKDNYSMEHMDLTEKQFIKTCKKLFENKCKMISAYEQLTKLQKIVQTQNSLTNSLAASIVDALDQTNNLLTWSGISSTSPETSSFQKVASKIRDLLLLNGYNTTTTWIQNTRSPNVYSNGAGTGVIELTLVTQFTSNTSIKFGNGSASFTVLDPNRLFAITEQDIERAIFETTDSSFSIVNNLADSLQSQYEELLQKLNDKRISRNASAITVKTNPYSRLYNRIIISLDRYGIELTDPSGNGLRNDLFNVSEKEAIENLNTILNVKTNAHYNISSLAETELFKSNETDLLKSIYEKSVMISTLREKDYTDFCNYGKSTNYIRRLMRLNFLGKQLIQPMDEVTSFITSRTLDDNAALAGLKSMFSTTDSAINGVKDLTFAAGRVVNWAGQALDDSKLQEYGKDIESYADSNDQVIRKQVELARQMLQTQSIDVSNMSRNGNIGVLGSLNKNIGDLKELWGGIFGTNKTNYALEAEKNALAGPEFPMYLYLSLRSYFGASDFGPCTFNGIITDVSESGQPGSNNLSVSCKDNIYYLTQVLYQDKPGLNQFNGHLYDPLTPFDLEFDETTGQINDSENLKLLDENVSLIESGILKYRFGRFVNQLVTSKNIYQTALEPINTSSDVSGFANYDMSDNGQLSTVKEIARKVFYNPDGFVYRWKKGIGTAWLDSNSKNAAGSVLAEDRIDNQVASIIRGDPFSNQDVVNVISLLITGEPYNINTFLNASITSGILRITPGQTINDYLSSLTRQIRKQNQMWGNFVPFKRFSINPTYFNTLYTSKLNLQVQSSKINQLEDKKAKLMDKLMEIDSSYQTTGNLNTLQGFDYNDTSKRIITVNGAASFALVTQIIFLDNEIKACQAKLENSLLDLDSIDGTNGQSPINIIGNDVYSSYDGDLDTMKNESRAAYKAAYNRLRMKQNFITQRKLWQVKSNTDTNLFIVCDEYDHDTDIQALMQNLGSLDLINSKSLPNVGSKIDALSKIVGLEVFANSQGHIEVRIPQYNKMPSSIFYKMLERKRKFGIQYYPSFLENTFKNRLSAVYEDIETTEDWIRIYTSILGYSDDTSRASFLAGSNVPTLSNQFIFLTDSTNGTLTSIRAASSQMVEDFTDDYENVKIISVTASSTKDFFERNIDESFLSNRYEYFKQTFDDGSPNATQLLNSLQAKEVKQQVENWNNALNVRNNFNPLQQMKSIKVIFKNNLTLSQIQEDNIKFNSELTQLIQRQSRRTGSKLNVASFIKNTFSNSKKYISPIDLISIEKKLATLISERYKSMLTATSLIRNLDQSARANSGNNDVLAGIMLPNLVKDGDIPDFMTHMIEDETEDDYGYQSGKRYVIKAQDIISSTYKEQPPEFTVIKVQGAQAGGLLPSRGFDVGAGMEVLSVWAVDYDLWRMYGFKEGSERFMPFMSNVETQLAPYAVSLLNQQRSNLFHGSITHIGNEFIQPGEVYYVEEKDMLFYCEQVTHNFSYGSYTTTMSLTYGHPIGEYIPTPLDSIGKSIYKGNNSNIGKYRLSNPTGGTTSSGIEIHLGTIAIDNDISGESINAAASTFDGKMLMDKSDKFTKQNNDTLINMSYKLQSLMTGNGANVSSSKYAVVSLRIYSLKQKYNKSLEQVAMYIGEYLQGKTYDDKSTNSDGAIVSINKERIIGGINDDENTFGTFRLVALDVNPNSICNMTFPGIRNPSGKAIELAKEIAVSNRGLFDSFKGLFTDGEDGPKINSKQIQNALCNCIVDVWIEYINPENAKIKTSIPFTTSNAGNSKTQTQNSSSDPTAVDKYYSKTSTTVNSFENGNASITIQQAESSKK